MAGILIIGASSGIGRALARLDGSEASNRLGLLARRKDLLYETAVGLPAHCELLAFDLEAPERGEKLSAFLDHFGTVELVVYCSGFGELNPELDWRFCRRTLDVNVVGFTEIANLLYRRFAEQGGGHLAVISSVGGLRGMENDSGYSASKGYMRLYLEGLARKAHKEKLPLVCTTILPGFVDTAMAKGNGFFWMCSAETAAQQIAAGLKRKKRYLYITRRWRLVGWLLKLIPYPVWEKL